MENYTEVRNGDHFITVTYDDDAAGWLGSEFNEGYPGVYVHDHAWRPNTLGDESVADDLQEWEDELENLQYEVDHATGEFNSAFEDYVEITAQRVVDAEESKIRHEALSNATAELANAADELQNHLGHNRWFTYNHCPYVDTNGYLVTIDKDEFAKVTGLDRDMSADEWEKHAMSAGKYADTLMHGHVYDVEVSKADFDDDTGEYVKGDWLDRVGGVVFNDNFPSDDEILTFVQADMGL